MRPPPPRPGEATAADAGRVARALHDGAAQAFFAIGATADTLLRETELDDVQRPALERIRALSSDGSASLRDAIGTLRRLDEGGGDDEPGSGDAAP